MVFLAVQMGTLVSDIPSHLASTRQPAFVHRMCAKRLKLGRRDNLHAQIATHNAIDQAVESALAALDLPKAYDRQPKRPAYDACKQLVPIEPICCEMHPDIGAASCLFCGHGEYQQREK